MILIEYSKTLSVIIAKKYALAPYSFSLTQDSSQRRDKKYTLGDRKRKYQR
jgi:hypothetical protein